MDRITKKFVTKIGDFNISDPLLEATNRGLVQLIDYLVEQVYGNEIFLLQRERAEVEAAILALNITEPSESTYQKIETFINQQIIGPVNDKITGYTGVGSELLRSVSSFTGDAYNKVKKFITLGANALEPLKETAVDGFRAVSNVISGNYVAATIAATEFVNEAFTAFPAAYENFVNMDENADVRAVIISGDDDQLITQLNEIDERIRTVEDGIKDLFALKTSILPENVYIDKEAEAARAKAQLEAFLSAAKSKCNLLVDTISQQTKVLVDSFNSLCTATNNESQKLVTTTGSGGGTASGGSSSLGRPSSPHFSTAIKL